MADSDLHAAEPQTAQAQNPNEKPLAEIPQDAMIILPVRNVVLFPGIILPLTLGRGASIAAAQEAARSNRPLGVLLQRDPEVEVPGPDDLYRVGTVGSIVRYMTAPDRSHHVICQGEHRIRVLEFLEGYPFLVARVERVSETEVMTPELEASMRTLKQRAAEALQLVPQAPGELLGAIEGIRSASALADLIASFIDIEPGDKQEILATFDVSERIERVLKLLAQRIEVMRLSQEINRRTKESMDERQREYMLREQLKAIQKELGEDEGTGAEIEELRAAIAEAKMPPEVEEQANKELRRLERMPEASGEYGIIRTYLDWLIALPWSKLSEENIDIPAARQVLDEDHYGLEKVKKRILEYLAVRKLNPEGRSPILCFVGPPGVGKTSLGQSIARALGLAFERVSLGGVHDEAEIRGHRRTYIGALPGNIIQAIRKAGTRNPVLMLDEIDKLGAGGFHGDPASAFLEVLDPAQNQTFRDNYLAVPFDLSKVFFIATANVIDSIPGPLRDRMEVIELSGYTEDEKVQIAKRYLLRRQKEANGLKPEQLEVTDAALHRIVRDYTREAGVRNLERQIGAVCRHVAVQVAEGALTQARVDADDLQEILGAPRFENEVALRTAIPGVVTGLAWTAAGGDILFIEASKVPGSGRLILTGQLGDVMKESAQAALSLVKSRAQELGVDPASFEKSDIHIHVPAGAIPKDGPSAGVAMVMALVSALTGKTMPSDMAMTGEISLRGQVLPVGGIKEKATAAARAGIKTVLMPARNRRDHDDIPASAREQLDFVWLQHVDDALEAAFGYQKGEDAQRLAARQ